jgi:hypothetical protein
MHAIAETPTPDPGRSEPACSVDLYWLPLGAGGHSVRLNGKVFEAVAARVEGRAPCALYHSALVVRVPDGRVVIEQAPAGSGDGASRGVVAAGAVGTAVPVACASSATRCVDGETA